METTQQPIVLDTPDMIDAWYMLSLRSRLLLQTKGLKTPGMIALINANGWSSKKTAKGCLVDIEKMLDDAGIQYTKH